MRRLARSFQPSIHPSSPSCRRVARTIPAHCPLPSQYSCGRFGSAKSRENNKVALPAALLAGGYDQFSSLTAQNSAQLRTLLRSNAPPPSAASALYRQARLLYRQCVDDFSRQRAGPSPVLPLLAKLDWDPADDAGWSRGDLDYLTAALAWLHRLHVMPFFDMAVRPGWGTGGLPPHGETVAPLLCRGTGGACVCFRCGGMSERTCCLLQLQAGAGNGRPQTPHAEQAQQIQQVLGWHRRGRGSAHDE